MQQASSRMDSVASAVCAMYINVINFVPHIGGNRTTPAGDLDPSGSGNRGRPSALLFSARAGFSPAACKLSVALITPALSTAVLLFEPLAAAVDRSCCFPAACNDSTGPSGLSWDSTPARPPSRCRLSSAIVSGAPLLLSSMSPAPEAAPPSPLARASPPSAFAAEGAFKLFAASSCT